VITEAMNSFKPNGGILLDIYWTRRDDVLGTS